MSSSPGPNLILFTEEPSRREELVAKLSSLNQEFQNLKITGLNLEAVARLERGAQAVILDLFEWSHGGETLLAGLRGTGYQGPILIAAKKPAAITMPKLEEGKLVFLEKPYQDREMLGLLRRMILAPIIAARKHPRHATLESAEVELASSRVPLECRMTNMSKGGAYLELSRAVHVSVGDPVVLRVKLGQVNRTYALRGRVAWLNLRGAGFGIEFSTSLGEKAS